MGIDALKTKSPDYLFRNPHSYYFRLIVTEDRRDTSIKGELRSHGGSV